MRCSRIVLALSFIRTHVLKDLFANSFPELLLYHCPYLLHRTPDLAIYVVHCLLVHLLNPDHKTLDHTLSMYSSYLILIVCEVLNQELRLLAHKDYVR